MSNENTISKSQAKKDLKALGYPKVSIRTRLGERDTYAKVYVYNSDGECLVGDFNVYDSHTLNAARAALEYIDQLPKHFDTGEIIRK